MRQKHDNSCLLSIWTANRITLVQLPDSWWCVAEHVNVLSYVCAVGKCNCAISIHTCLARLLAPAAADAGIQAKGILSTGPEALLLRPASCCIDICDREARFETRTLTVNGWLVHHEIPCGRNYRRRIYSCTIGIWIEHCALYPDLNAAIGKVTLTIRDEYLAIRKSRHGLRRGQARPGSNRDGWRWPPRIIRTLSPCIDRKSNKTECCNQQRHRLPKGICIHDCVLEVVDALHRHDFAIR